MTLKAWAHGLGAAIVSGAASAVSGIVGASFTGVPIDWKQIGAAATGGALIAAVLYLKQSPLPAPDK